MAVGGNYDLRVRIAWPLIGREEQLAAISRTLAGGDYAGVVLAGDAGVGKSRLVREALAVMSRRCDVRWVAATVSGRALPLGAFAEWAQDAGSDPMALVRSVVDALTATTRGHPVVLGVDDAHVLDDLSAFVVHQLVHRRLAKVIITVRNPESPPESITTLWKDSYLKRVELAPLTRDESDRLVAAALGGTVDSGAAQRLWKLTRGNVLFLRHLVEQEVASGRLRRERDVWSWLEEPIAFTTLGQLIDAQMGALSEPVGEVLDLLAVGEPLDGEVLAGMVGAAAIDEARASGLISLTHEGQQSTVRLAHPMYGEVRRSRAATFAWRHLRGRVFRALADADIVDSRDLIRRALLLIESDLSPDAILFTQAAGAAMQLLDPVLAGRLAGAARQLDGNYEATMLHTGALHLVGQVTEAEQLLVSMPDRRFTPDQRSNLAHVRAANLFWGLGLTDRAAQILDEAQARIPAASHGSVTGFRAVMLAANGSASEAIDAANAVLASNPSDVVAMGAYVALMFALGYAGRADAVAEVAKNGYSIAETFSDASPVTFAFTAQHIQALILAGYQSDAQALAERWALETVDLPLVFHAYAPLFMGQAELGAGRVSGAREWLEKAMPTFTRFEGEKYGSIICTCDLVAAQALSGDDVRAAAALSVLEAQHNPYGFLESRCALAAAWVAAAQDATAEAMVRAWDAAGMARGRGHFAQEALCLQTATRFGDGSTAERLAKLGDVVEGPRVGAAAAHAAALAARDADGLVAASVRCEGMGDVLSAADAAAQAAVIFRAADRRGSALSARERAQGLAEQCGGALTPALRVMGRPALTDRQREILELAEQGLTSREIAQRLSVSVRTVQGHRYRARKR